MPRLSEEQRNRAVGMCMAGVAVSDVSYETDHSEPRHDKTNKMSVRSVLAVVARGLPGRLWLRTVPVCT